MITLKSTFRGDQFLFAPAEEVDFYLAKSREEPTYHLHEEAEVADIEDTTLDERDLIRDDFN